MPKFNQSYKIIKDSSPELVKIKSDPRFKARMAKVNSTPIISKYDIPYLCGYSKDAKKVYFDRHLNVKMKGHDISKFLRLRELVEKAILDIFGMKYQQANQFASYFERKAVEDAGINWNEYNKYIQPYVKQVSRDHLKKVPKDLDLQPYLDPHEKKTIEQIQSVVAESFTLVETKISLEYHDQLNPKLWDGARLKPEVREKLLEFGYAWADFAKIPRTMIVDMIMTGGNANYNYTSKSDIDVHLVMDRYSFAPGTSKEIIDEYFQDKKVLWTLTHKIQILGYALEPYAQDNVDRYPANQGVYSLKRDTWVQYPNKGDYNFKDDPGLKRKVMFYVKMIDSMIKDKMDAQSVRDIKSKIRDMRGAAIAKGGEFSFENLVFKELRNRGYLDKINKYEQTLKDKSLSL